MKFTCEKSQFLYAINTTIRAAAAKSAVPALEGLLIEAGAVVNVTGYDLKKGIRSTINADVIEDGNIVINARLLAEIVRKLDDDVVTVRATDANLVTVSCGMSVFEIMGISAMDYPDLPSVENTNYITVKNSVLKSMIGETLFAVSDNEARPIHTGSLFDIGDANLTVVSVDGYRLALRREMIEEAHTMTNSFVVPGYALTEVERILDDDDGALTKIHIGSKQIMFAMDNTTVVSRRLEGEFLNYKNSIPKTNKFSVKVDRKALINTVERVSLIISDKLKSPVRCRFGDDTLNVYTSSALGKASDTCPTEGSADNMEIGFNNKYLLDALRAAPADTLKLNLSGGTSPCIIVPDDDSDKFLYMVLPVRLRANEN